MNKIFFVTIFFIIYIPFSNAQTDYFVKTSVKGKYSEERYFRVNLFKSDRLEYSISKSLSPHNSIPNVEALSNGNLMLIHSLEGMIEIYDNTSSKIFQREFYKFPPYREQQLKCRTNKNGFVVISSEMSDNQLFLLTNDGNQIFKKQLGDGLITGLTSSDMGNIISYSAVKWQNNKIIEKTEFINNKGDLISSLPTKFEKGRFNNESTLFTGITKHFSFCVNLLNNKIIWIKQLTEDEIFIDALVVTSETMLITSEIPYYHNKGWNYPNVKMIKKLNTGKEELLNEFRKSINEIRFSNENNAVFLILDETKIPIKLDD